MMMTPQARALARSSDRLTKVLTFIAAALAVLLLLALTVRYQPADVDGMDDLTVYLAP